MTETIAPAGVDDLPPAPNNPLPYRQQVSALRTFHTELEIGLVVGDLVTPVPVNLDGQSHTVTVALEEHTVTVPLEEIAYTMSPHDSLTLQLIGSATAYENLTSVGMINVSAVQLTLPTVGAAAVGSPPESARRTS